jgi:5-methylcytosine-specific restriction endonuclease McrA
MTERRSDCKQVELVCPSCQAVFLRRPSVIGTVNYCSRACFADAIRGLPGRSGEAHPRWKGNEATIGAGHMRAIAAFGAQPCAVCGASPDDVRIHRHHRDQNPLNNAATNIAFLCPTHHAAEHKRLRRQRREIAS